jgi:dolichol-phosphate mannosyltransferase
MREKNRYLPGMRAWVGYKNSIVYYDRNDRLGGEGKLSFISRIKYAMDAITSFSYKPLRLSFGLFGFTTAMATLLAFGMLLPLGTIATVGFGVASSVFFVGGMLLLMLGILGEYLGRVYDEVRNRPLSLISQVHRSSVMVPSQVGLKAVQTAAYGVQTEAFALAADQGAIKAA